VLAAGFEAHLAEPADTQAARGRKRHAKTDRSDCRLLRELLADGRRPESWIAPTLVRRERARLYKTLIDQRSTWVQRIHAELFQHGVAVPESAIRWGGTRQLPEDDQLEISTAGGQRILTAYRMIDAITNQSRPLKTDLQRFGTRQPGCRALVDNQYGIGGLLAAAIWSELGDCQRFSRSEQVVRHSGLDASDRRLASGFLSRQGPQTLRWALYEAAKNASHRRHAAPTTTTTPTSKPTLRWHANSPDAASTYSERSIPSSSTRHPENFRRGCWSAPPTAYHESSRNRLPQPVNRRARQHPCWTASEH
jgi:transposase